MPLHIVFPHRDAEGSFRSRFDQLRKSTLPVTTATMDRLEAIVRLNCDNFLRLSLFCLDQRAERHLLLSAALR